MSDRSRAKSSVSYGDYKSSESDMAGALLSFAAEDEQTSLGYPTPITTADEPRSERTERARVATDLSRTSRSIWTLAALCALLVTATGLALGAYYRRPIRAVRDIPTTSSAFIDSRPQGLAAIVDDQVRGRTPLRLSLPFGSHTLELQDGSDSRHLTFTVESGTTTSQFIDFGPETRPVRTGRLEVSTDPLGAIVRVDGAVAGTTPLTLQDIPAGEHKILVGVGDAAVRRTVTILPGATASVVVSGGPSTAPAGWLKFRVPFEMQIFEGGQLVGTTDAERIMLPAGTHKFDLVSEPLEFRTTATVQVTANTVATNVVIVPNGLLSANALPWADVEVDGRPLGTTPLANISLPIGPHEVVWKNPQLGERRKTIALTATTPVRVGVDFNQ
jgi:hypothetical protein